MALTDCKRKKKTFPSETKQIWWYYRFKFFFYDGLHSELVDGYGPILEDSGSMRLFRVVGNELRVVMRQRQRSNPSHINSDHTAVVRSRESLAITSSGKITFSKEWTVKNRGWCWVRSKEYQLLINRSTPLMAIKHHVTAVLPQYVLHVSEQWQGNPRKVFSWPRGTGLRLFWAPVCS